MLIDKDIEFWVFVAQEFLNIKVIAMLWAFIPELSHIVLIILLLKSFMLRLATFNVFSVITQFLQR